MSNPEKEQAELMSIQLDHVVEMGEALKRLQRNGDFKKIITNGYLKNKVLASVSLLGVPQIQAEGKRPMVMEDLVAASNLQFFLRMIENDYEATKNPILSDQEEAEMAQMAAAEEASAAGLN